MNVHTAKNCTALFQTVNRPGGRAVTRINEDLIIRAFLNLFAAYVRSNSLLISIMTC